MAASETKKINEKSCTARCLTVAELRTVLQAQSGRKVGDPLDLVEYLVEDGLPKEAFYLSLGLDGEKDLDFIEDPADIITLMEMVAKANPTYAVADKRNLADLKAQVSLISSLKTAAPT